MRIAVVAPGFAPDVGGVETVVSETTRAMAARGHDVEVWTQQRTGGTTVDDIDGIVVRRFPASSSRHYSVSPSLWRSCRRELARFDVIHAHSYHSSVTLGLIRSRFGAPLIYSPHYHGVGHTAPARLLHNVYRPVAARVIRRASVVVAVSKAEQELLRRRLGVQSTSSVVVHHGVDGQAIQAADPLPNEPPTALVIARLERYKRVDRVIEAFAAHRGEAQLVVIGDGPDRSRLERLAAGMTQPRSIRFLGQVNDDVRRRWLVTAHLLVSMSEREAFGLVALEAAAAGKHALLSDLPAHREVAALAPEAITLVPSGELQLRAALQDRLSRGAPRRIVPRTWEDVADDYLTLYDAQLTAASS
jgi:glycosyltransferase involved in cell wall biosynthesis